MKRSTLFKAASVAFFLLFLFPQPGCKKDKIEPEPEPEPEIIIAENTKVIADQDWNSNIVSIDTNDYTLTFDDAINVNYDLKVGDVVVSSVGYGLLRKITDISSDGQNIIISTEQASLSDAILKGELKFKVDVSNPQKIKKIKYQADGVKFIKPKDGDESQFLIEISTDFGTDFFSITGELEIGQFEFEADYDWHTEWFKPILDTAYGLFSITETFTLTEELSHSAEFEKSVELLILEYPPITVMIGPVPVVITPEVVLTAGIELEATCSLSAGLTQELTASGGLAYDGSNWNPSFNLEKNFGITPPLLTNSLSAKVYVKPQLNMVIYKIFKPNVSVQPYASLEAEFGNTPWWYFYLGLRSDIGMEVDLIITDLFDVEANLFDKQFEIANSGDEINNFPEASFTVNPLSAGIGTNFHFDASGCEDEEDPLEDLQVRWDWEDDGVWDTDFMYEKEIDHAYTNAGDYMIRLEVIDTEDASDKITHEVTVNSNHPPEASFTVSPLIGGIGSVFHLDASDCEDEEDPLRDLQVRWDWENDGIWDTDFMYEKKIEHAYTIPNNYTIKLEVIDTENLSDEITHEITVTNNHAPVAAFSVNPYNGTTDTIFRFNASFSTDEEDPVEDLQVRWDWDGNGVFDTDFSYEKQETHQYLFEGSYTPILEVKDSDGATDEATQTVTINNIVPCPGFETIEYGGQIYNTVLIGNQCWFKENLNIGTRIPISSAQTDNGVIEKYCYEDDGNYCDIYGALYQWNELMQYTETPGSQGLCPEGWHVPTDGDWKVLEGTVDSLYDNGDPEWDKTGYRGYNAGLYLKSAYWWQGAGNGIDKYGFTVLPAGYSNFNTGNSYDLGRGGSFWTSNKGYINGTAIRRKFSYTSDKIHRYSYSVHMTYGYSIRCLKDD
ncbi:MAG: hypothetical protein KQH67_06825 [Bacteroidetes bacterium]|nr:hypothetical protein [Bacteroidota bacterium]